MVDFTQVLARPAGKAEPPKQAPVGAYKGVVANYKFTEVGDNDTPCISIVANYAEAGPDVDPEALAEFKMEGKKVMFKLFLTDDALFMFDQFLAEHCGLTIEGRSYEDVIENDLKGAEFGFIIKHIESKKNPEQMLAVVDRTCIWEG